MCNLGGNMSIRYIIGRSATGKSHLVLEEIKKNLNSGTHKQKKLILIVPQQYTLQAERNLIEKLNLPGIIDVEVLSFDRLAYNVLNEVGGITRIHIDGQGKNMILRKIIDETKDKLSIYRTASAQDGFISLFDELLTELKQNKIAPEDLKKMINDSDGDKIINNKLNDITQIYEKFNRYLEGRYIDSEDYINLLIEKIEASSLLKDAKIWIDGFNSFTPQTYHVISKLCVLADEITVTLTMDLDNQRYNENLFELTDITYHKLRSIALEHNLAEELIDLNRKKRDIIQKTPEIKHIEQELYAYPYRIFEDEVKNVELFAGLNPHSELENVAVKIISLVRDKGYRWRDIAVVSNGLEGYAQTIMNVFDDYQIPYFIDQKRSIMHNPIIELILSVLAIIDKGYRYNDVFKYLKTGFTGLKLDEVERLENYALEHGIQGDKWNKEFINGDSKQLESLNKSRRTFIEKIKILETQIKGNKTVGQITKAIYSFLTNIKLNYQLEKWIDYLRDNGMYEYVYENTQIWNIIMSTFDQLVEILGDQKVTVREYQRILESGFTSLQISIIPTTIDQVLIGNIARSKSNDIKALFIVGVNDGILPAGKDFDGILADDERILFKDNGMPLGIDRQTKAAEERLMIYSAFSKPSEYLFVSYTLANNEGKTMRPSLIIDRLKKIFLGIDTKSDLAKDNYLQRQMISTPRSTLKHLTNNLRFHLDGLPIEPIWFDVYNWYAKNNNWYNSRKNIEDGLFHKNQVNDIGKESAKKIYKTPIKASVSRLEQFVNCPFSHFIKYGLRPQERKEFEVKAPDIGEVFHKALELFTIKLKEENLNWRDITQEQCYQIIDNSLDELIPSYGNGVMQSTHRYRYLVQRLKRISRRAAWILTEHIKRSGFEPIGFEVGFGVNKSFPPLEIELSDGEKIYLEGRIDRVDIFDDGEKSYLKVVDYKSGNKEFNLSEVYHGLQLQLMVYLSAVLANSDKLNKKELVPAGALYFRIDDPLVKNHEKIAEVVEKELRRELKMKGLILKDVNIVKQIDQLIDGYSDIIPVGLKKNDEFYKNSSVAENDEFKSLLNHVNNLTKDIAEEILGGNIRIEPIKNGKFDYCTFCDYQAICQFNQMFEDNKYKVIKKISKEEVLVKVMAKKEGTINAE